MDFSQRTGGPFVDQKSSRLVSAEVLLPCGPRKRGQLSPCARGLIETLRAIPSTSILESWGRSAMGRGSARNEQICVNLHGGGLVDEIKAQQDGGHAVTLFHPA